MVHTEKWFVPRLLETDDHVVLEANGRIYNTRWIGLGDENERKWFTWTREASFRALTTAIFLALATLPNALCFGLLRAGGVVVGHVSKKLFTKHAAVALPRLRLGTLRNLALVAILLSGMGEVNASGGASKGETIPLLTMNSTEVFNVNHNAYMDLLSKHYVECSKMVHDQMSFQRSSCQFVFEQYHNLTYSQRLYHFTPIRAVVEFTHQAFDATTQYVVFYFALTMRLDTAILIGYVLVLTILFTMVVLPYVLLRVFLKAARRVAFTIRYYGIPFILEPAKVEVDQVKAVEMTRWVQTDQDGVLFESNVGKVRINAAELARLINVLKEKPASLETAKEGSTTQKASAWPSGGCWLLRRREDGNLFDNGGCTRVILGGRDFMVTTLHQMKAYATNASGSQSCVEFYLQGPKGARTMVVSAIDEWFTIENLEFVLIPMRQRDWPNGVGAASYGAPSSASFDFITGTFHGMVNGELHFSTGKIEAPKTTQVGHYATTYPGWCGWPVQVGMRFMFLHFMGATPKNYCLPIGSILMAFDKRFSRDAKNQLEIDSDKFVLQDALEEMRQHEQEMEYHKIFRGGTGEWGMEIYSHATGQSYILHEETARAFIYEKETGRYRDENYDETSARIESDRYDGEVEDWERKVDMRSKRERREDELDEKNRNLDRKEAEEEWERKQALAGSGMAAALTGAFQAPVNPPPLPAPTPKPPAMTLPPGVTWSAPVQYKCVCGSQDPQHQCATKVNLLTATSDQLKQIVAALPPAKKVHAVGDQDSASLEGPPKSTQETKRQDFRDSPDKAPVAASQPAVPEEKLPKEVAEQPAAAKPQGSKRKRKKKAKKVAPSLEGPPSKPDSKAQFFLWNPEYDKLPWSQAEQVMKEGKAVVGKDQQPKMRRKALLADGRLLLTYSDLPNQVMILPPRSKPELKLGPSLSVLLASGTSSTPSSSGSSSPAPQSTGSSSQATNTVSQTPPREEKRNPS